MSYPFLKISAILDRGGDINKNFKFWIPLIFWGFLSFFLIN